MYYEWMQFRMELKIHFGNSLSLTFSSRYRSTYLHEFEYYYLDKLRLLFALYIRGYPWGKKNLVKMATFPHLFWLAFLGKMFMSKQSQLLFSSEARKTDQQSQRVVLPEKRSPIKTPDPR